MAKFPARHECRYHSARRRAPLAKTSRADARKTFGHLRHKATVVECPDGIHHMRQPQSFAFRHLDLQRGQMARHFQ